MGEQGELPGLVLEGAPFGPCFVPEPGSLASPHALVRLCRCLRFLEALQRWGKLHGHDALVALLEAQRTPRTHHTWTQGNTQGATTLWYKGIP